MVKKRIILLFIILLVVGLTAIYFCDKAISNYAEGKMYSETSAIPYNKVGVLLGTSKFLPGKVINPYYFYRIEATLKLMRDARIKYLIISGDNGSREYNEPEMMRADLMRSGIDSAHIFLDYAGFRTFDSMVRLKEIFGQDSVTVISQPFHNERAIYTAGRLHISAIGFNAKDVSGNQGLKTQIREKLARVKVFLDFIFGKHAKFLGSKITIPA
jgi:SanA protein